VLATQATLKVTTAFGCVAQRTQTIRTFPLVQAQFAQSVDSGCSPLAVTFSNQAPQGNRTSWYIGGQYVGASTSAFAYTFVNETGRDSVVQVLLAVEHPLAPGCVDTLRRSIKVFAKPIAGLLTMEPASGCSPLVATLRGSATGAVRYRISFGDGQQADTSGQVVSHRFVNNTPVQQTFNTILIALSAKGCADTATSALRVRPQIIARISALDTAGCTPLLARLSGANSQNANAFTWDFGDNSIQGRGAEVAHNFTNLSDSVRHYTVRMIADRSGVGCPDTTYRRITVYPKPIADVVASATEACTPFPLRLIDQSTTQGHTTKLVFTDGVDVDTVVMRGSRLDTVLLNTGSTRKSVYVDVVTSTGFGCTDTRRLTLFVNPPITARFNKPASGCSPLTVNFRNTSLNTDDIYEWNFGDGSATSATKNPVHVFRYTGYRDTTFIVTLRSRSNAFYNPVCEAVYTDTVRVSGRPVGAFSLVPDGTLRLPNTKLTVLNQTAYRSAWRYQWSFGDGTTSTDSAAQFTHDLTGLSDSLATTNLKVRMIVIGGGGCPDTVIIPLTILPIKPVAAFEGPDSGCAPHNVIFKNNSKWANTYYWTFGDGTSSTEQNPSHRYTQPGDYNVRLMVSGLGGGDTLLRESIIKVFEVPSASFTTFPRAPRKLKLPDDLLTCILRYPSPGETYRWDFGDGTTSDTSEPRHLYKAAGAYIINLTVTSEHGCVASDTSKTPVEAENGAFWLLPNAFTPNPNGGNGGAVDNSGYNDVFYPFTEGVTEIDMQIFNRWGTCIYRSTTVGVGWDGYVQGALAQADTYVYKIKAKFSTGEIKQKVGDLSLIR
jgi:gliding motility-associated-like protein